jgi:PAS domain S-box-containing protein
MPKAKHRPNPSRGSNPGSLIPATESQDIVRAIRAGQVDALVVAGDQGDQIVVLQNAELPYRLLIETISDGAATLNSDGTVLYANKRLLEILDVRSEDFIGTPVHQHFPRATTETISTLIATARQESAQGEVNLDGEGGRQRFIRLSLNPVAMAGHHTICLVATELTELLEANEALKANEESLRQLSARLLQLQDEERRRIARDLHDTSGQKLAIQSMLLNQLESMATSLDPQCRQVLAECKSLTNQLVEEIRTVSYLLHPPLLDELGLSSALKWYAEGFSRRTGIETEVEISSNFQRLPRDIEVTLFRVIQESLTNVHRYSGSPKAIVRVNSSEDRIVLEIRDFGRGIQRETLGTRLGSIAPIGVGIQGMKERMRQLSGKLEITSRPQKGTVVTATLPMASLRMTAAEESANSELLSPAQSESREAAANRSIPLKRVLVADDHELLRRGVCTLLQTELDIEKCVEAVDGRDAVEKAAATKPDLVIIDVEMPGLNGLDATREILRNCPQTKVLIFTVHESEEMLRDIAATGAHACLSKNKGGKNLLRVIKELFGNTASHAATQAHH